MAKFKLNGREVEAPVGALVIKVAIDNGFFIPHFCWHPGLTPEGNCRMCLVKTNTSRKLEPACMMRVPPNKEGAPMMEVETETPDVQKARKDVLEFLLVNHPLDCPVCDKAGECLLQDYTYNWRGGLSRFIGLQAKEVKQTKDLGPNIRIWGSRCVVCTRCVRFCNEVSGSGELTVVNRGDHSVIDTAPGVVLDNPLSLNVVDICPVGALIDKNFLYSARVWYMQKTRSVCASCSRGCNIEVQALDGKIRRLVPRYNAEVNGYWMCDAGRLNFRYVGSQRRLTERRGTPAEIVRAFKRYPAEARAALISSYNTCEEIYLFKKVIGTLDIPTVGYLTLTRGKTQKFPGGFVIEADKTPNRRYLEATFGEQEVINGPSKVISGLADGKIKALFVVNGIPDFPWPAELWDAAKKAEFVAVIDVLKNPLAEFAHVLLPGATWAEKDGTFVNVDGRAQRIRRGVPPPGNTRPETELLQEMLVELGERKQVLSAEGVAKECRFDWAKIGDLGHKNGY